MLYGPFKFEKKDICKSNHLFDQSLKIINNNWGVRNIEEVRDEAFKNGFQQEKIIDMPVNNFSLIYRKLH